MGKYYEIEGFTYGFTPDSRFSPDSRFNAFVEAEDRTYCSDTIRGKINIRYFRGGRTDKGCGMLLGGFERGEGIGDTMYFYRVAADQTEAPMIYGFEKHADGIYSGSCRQKVITDDFAELAMLKRVSAADITRFVPLTNEQAEQKHVKEFLEKCYAENSLSKMPHDMCAVAKDYEARRAAVVSAAKAAKQKEMKVGYRCPAALKHPGSAERCHPSTAEGNFTTM